MLSTVQIQSDSPETSPSNMFPTISGKFLRRWNIPAKPWPRSFSLIVLWRITPFVSWAPGMVRTVALIKASVVPLSSRLVPIVELVRTSRTSIDPLTVRLSSETLWVGERPEKLRLPAMLELRIGELGVARLPNAGGIVVKGR